MGRFRLHRSSLVVGMATLVVLTLTVVPGVEEPEQHPIIPSVLHHGWPWQFCERQVDWVDPGVSDVPTTGFYGVPWLSPTSWKFWQGEVDFHWRPLALDVLVAVGIAGATVALWERRRRRRASAWQFQLAEVLLAMTVIAAAFGWLNWQRVEHIRELAIEDALGEVDSGPAFYLGWQYSGPEWLKRLVGLELLPDYLYEFDSAYAYEFDTESDCLAYEEKILPYLKSLRRLQSLELNGPMSDWTEVFRTLRELPHLRTLDLTFCEELCLTASEVNQLATLKQLAKLVLRSRESVTEEAQRNLVQRMTHCEIVYDYDSTEWETTDEATGD